MAIGGGLDAKAQVGPLLGIGYSGGGISGIINAMCAHDALTRLAEVPEDAVVSTASGGTLGYLLHQSLGDALSYPPPLRPNLSFEELSSRQTPDGKTWFGKVVDFLPTLMQPPAPMLDPRAPSSWPDCFPVPNSQDGWWQDVMLALFSVAYGVPSSQVGNRGVGRFVQNFAMIKAAALPMARDANNCMAHAEEALRHATLEAIPGQKQLRMHITGNVTLEPASGANWTLLDAAAYSSAFYAAEIIEGSSAYAAERAAELVNKGTLISACTQDNERVHLIDGGFVDTTGIVSLLQRRVRRILAFYGNNDCLKDVGTETQCETASIAFLFGESRKADSMNSLLGPKLTQVFSNVLYNDAIRNLTDPNVLRARFTNVEVIANANLEVEAYTVEELIIISNSRSQAFVDTFTDSKVRNGLDDAWPDRMPIGMNPFDANMLCEFNWWKLHKYADEVKSLIAGLPPVPVQV
jgi:hypothetical protein